MQPIRKLVATTGTYTDHDGNEKKRYQRVGTIFKRDDGSVTIKIDSIPIGEWNGWLSAYPLEDQQQPQGQQQQQQPRQQAAQDFQQPVSGQGFEDIPF